ncbi:MAG: tyrosine--tRNA ligase [Desulfobacteraceae bacterium]|nr:tyrosine--tRNA ligase [Desulfobacteraceae bacterium]
MNVLDILQDRGFVDNVTHGDELQEYLSSNNVTCYIGFDPTADSLHVGSLVPLMALAHMQKNGHRPIGLVGGGTGLIGDPSGKTEMRKIITHDAIEDNKKGIRRQLERFLDFEDDKALLLDNADWLTGLEYIPFLRDIGRHFSVNRMIKAEGYKTRLDSEEGLNFIEFNYMLLQSYDFMQLAKEHNCLLQMGGSDQWGNIVSGIDLVRRTLNKQAFGITFPLITTSSGIKMGKTHAGAVWLDPERTSPYDYYQFWINADDADVEKFLALFTFLPMAEIEKVGKLEGAELNKAKAILAFEATVIAHGNTEAEKVFKAAISVFGGFEIPNDLLRSSSIPRKSYAGSDESVPATEVNEERMDQGVSVVDLFLETSLCSSKSEARRLIKQGGGYVNNIRIESIDKKLFKQDFEANEALLRAGKKKYHKIILI